MLEERRSLSEHFRQILVMVVGQAFGAAGYELEHKPMQWAGGMFRYIKSDEKQTYIIEFQVLVYTDNAWSEGEASQFRVTLIRKNGSTVRRTLSQLVYDDFGVTIIPSADHWWSFKDTHSLGQALAEAGHLVVGYGMPYLSGDLEPPNSQSSG